MTIYNIADIDELSKILDACTADVTLQTADGGEYSWKASRNAFLSLSSSLHTVPVTRIRVDAQNAVDRGHLLRFAMGSYGMKDVRTDA